MTNLDAFFFHVKLYLFCVFQTEGNHAGHDVSPLSSQMEHGEPRGRRMDNTFMSSIIIFPTFVASPHLLQQH